MNVKHPYFDLSSFALHQNVARSFSHSCAKFCSVPLSSYRVMRFQTLKIGQNMHANMEGFHRDSHTYIYIYIYIYTHTYVYIKNFAWEDQR